MVIDDYKYSVKVIRRAPFIFNVQLNKSNVDVVARKLGDGGFLLQVNKLSCSLAGKLQRQQPLQNRRAHCKLR
jgi:hypothetical protein